MYVLSLVLCFNILFFCACEDASTEAEDCILYEGQVGPSTSPTKTMYRQLSTGVQPKGDQFVATLSLTSMLSGETCNVYIHGVHMAVSCSHRSRMFEWSPEIFKEQDVTDLWIHLGSLNESKDTSSTDLAIIGRRGSHRGHLLFPSSGLRPPVQVSWTPLQWMDYYYNCVTGCVFTKSATTSPGIHSIFLRPGENFTQLQISYTSLEHRTSHQLTLNSSDISLDENWKNVTVVWNKGEGDIGVLVDGLPIGELGKYTALAKKSGIEAEITGEGYLTLCDQRFQAVGDARSDEDFLNQTALPPSASPSNLNSYDVSRNWLVILALVCMCLLLLVAIILVVLLLRTKKELQRERDLSAREVIAVESFGGPRTATNKSTAPLYPSGGTLEHDSSLTSENSKRVKSKAPAVPSGGSSQNGPGSRT